MKDISPITSRILTVDDNDQIHQDFHRCLVGTAPADEELDAMDAAMFGRPEATAEGTREQYRLDIAMQGMDALTLVTEARRANDPYQLAFVDMRMPPGWDGLQTIEALWKVDADLQIVICTAYSDYSWDEIQMRLGKTDKLLILRKPFDPVEVCQMALSLSEKWRLSKMARIKHAELQALVSLRTGQLEQAMQQDRLRMDLLESVVAQRTSELRHAALHDKLTGLPNRSMISDQLAEVLGRRAADPSRQFSVLFLDLDDFKLVNDTMGHIAGDQLLIRVAERLAHAAEILENDCQCKVTAARLGGDEFIVLMENVVGMPVEKFATRLLGEISRPYEVLTREVRCGVSIGITSSAMEYDSVEQLLRDADIAMYRAKVSKNSHVTFTREMHEQVVARVSMEDEMRRGLERGEFVLHYQPIVSLSSGILAGFEALARWDHPERGCVRPDAFIPLAERTGLICPLGLRLLEIAAAQLAAWKIQHPAQDITMSVNLSPRQLDEDTLPRELERIMKSTGADPSRMILEITEGYLSENIESADRLLRKLRKMRFRVSIDDFGTGHSSLGRLPILPIDGVKIDRTFLRNASEQRKSAAIINAVVNLAYHIDATVVAEGIETIEQIALLQTLNCEFGQGYYFSPPVPAADVERFFTEQWLANRPLVAAA